jgi:hypothetical protein
VGRRQTSVEIQARKHDRPVINIIQEHLELMPGDARERNKPSACLFSTWGHRTHLKRQLALSQGPL